MHVHTYTAFLGVWNFHRWKNTGYYLTTCSLAIQPRHPVYCLSIQDYAKDGSSLHTYIYIVFWFNKIAEIFAELGIQTKILAQCNDCISTIILEYSYKMHVNLEYQMQFLACSILLTCLPVRIDIALSSAKFRSNAFFTRRLIAKLCVIPHFYTYYIFLGFVSIQSADSGSPK
jgi:hypothetical protein